MDFIEQKEFGTRGLYGVPVGYIDIYDDCEFIVAIRSMLIKKAQATLFAGCGIVKDSDPDSELAETNLKFTPMMNALGVDMNGNHKAALTKQVFTFASELYAYGVREVVISPGSRSRHSALAFEAHPNIKTWIHPDERSAAFFAVGLIKGSERPVAILCTSGTAAANYTPAIAESQISRIPLIVLTSDRPHELRSVGAPQAINQVNMFNNYVSYEFDMPIADDSKETIDAIYYQMQIASQYLYGPHKGPIHFNLPFRDPLTPDLNATELLTSEYDILPHYQK